jgi:hypothetical protein
MEIPAHAVLQNEPRLTPWVLQILMRDVSTRNYRAVIREMANSVGVSRSSVSRQIARSFRGRDERVAGATFFTK